MDSPQQLPSCDLILKGGITSGIVYPPAVVALARAFRFKNVGGTSAGAIAAAVTVAAECGRRHGESHVFQRVEALSGELRRTLAELLAPEPRFAGLHAVLTSTLPTGGGGPQRAARLAAALLVRFFWGALAGALPGLFLLTALAQRSGPAPHPWLDAAAWVCALLVAAAGALLGSSTAALWRACGLRENLFGLARAREGLAGWLERRLDELAGPHLDGAPLTFRHLWSAPLADDEEPAWTSRDGAATRTVNLEVVTTCLTLGQPYSLPFETRRFYFDPAEWRRLFSDRIVDWLVANARARPGRPVRRTPDDRPLVPLPEAEDMPVVVATRMSLSFPGLLAAVPLYTVDYTRQALKGASQATRDRARAERCWFSDGGLCSNFPIHFFDQVLPRWPTFGINLRTPHVDYPIVKDDQGENVWMANDNHAGIGSAWQRFDQGPLGGLPGFVATVLWTMKDWGDNLPMRMPGQRDRVVHISLDDAEGGLNVHMPEATMERLEARGRAAGDRLVTAFHGSIWWPNHRWLRYRSGLAALQKVLVRFAWAWNDRGATPSYPKLLKDPPSYPWKRQAQQTVAGRITEALATAGQASAAGEDLKEGAPRPVQQLRLKPPF